MVELYGIDANASGRLTNFSVRTTIGPGEGALYVYLQVRGNGSKTLLLRGVGEVERDLEPRVERARLGGRAGEVLVDGRR